MISTLHKSTSKVWRLMASLAIVLSLFVALSSSAWAGNVTIQDDANLINSSDESSLQNKAKSFNYNVTIYTSNAFNSVNDFTNEVNNRLSRTSGNTIIIGVSGNLKNTRIAAKGISVDSPEATQISQAANSFFQAGNYGAGINAMLDRTNQLARVGTTSSGSSSNGTRSTSNSSSGGGFPFLGCIVIGIIALVAMSIFGAGRRRAVRNDYHNNPAGGPGYGGPGYGAGPGPGGPGYGNPGYGNPGYNNNGGYNNNNGGYNNGGYNNGGYNNGGGSGLGAGLAGGAIGAVGGGLIGYELGRQSGNNNDVGSGGGSFNSGAGGSSDAGSGGSDWGSSASSSDGGGSTFDAGGGGDWGGSSSSGGDSGGGGDSW